MGWGETRKGVNPMRSPRDSLHVYIQLTSERGVVRPYELFPLESVYVLRTLLAEDHRVREDRVVLSRHGQLLADEDALEHEDIITVWIAPPS